MRGGRNGSAFQYELLIDAEEAPEAWQVGLRLLESARLRQGQGQKEEQKHEYKADLTSEKGHLTAPYQAIW